MQQIKYEKVARQNNNLTKKILFNSKIKMLEIYKIKRN